MSVNPDGAPSRLRHKAGATAYLIDAAGTYSLPGANESTIDPAVAYGDPGASSRALAAAVNIPDAQSISSAAETVDSVGAYTIAGAGVAVTDLADAYGLEAGAPMAVTAYLADGEAAFAEAEIADSFSAYSLANPGAPTIDRGVAYRSPGASSPTLAAAGAYAPDAAAGATADIVSPDGAYGGGRAAAPTIDRHGARGASAPTSAPVKAETLVSGAPPAAADILYPVGVSGPAAAADLTATLDLTASPDIDPNGAPAGYYYQAGATAYIEDPAGTYSLAGATAPIADPGGTYSGAGASAPATDPAGTYSSPYALNRLFLEIVNTTPGTSVLSFNSATAVANYYGATSAEASLANEFFAGYAGASATMLFTRYCPLGERSHLLGANVSDLTLSQLQSISGSLSITFQGYTYSGSINLSGVSGFSTAATAIESALNSNLQVAAVTAGSSITPVSVSFTGSIKGILLQVTSVSSGSIELGADISGPGIPARAQIVVQLEGTTGGPGEYAFFGPEGDVSSETMTEPYGVLTVGSVTSGTVAVGQEVTGAGVLPLTAIEDNLSGSGPGSTWIVNNAKTVAGENLTMTATPLSVVNVSAIGATANNDFFDVSTNSDFGYDNNPSTLSYMSGTAAAALGLTQESGAIDSTPGGQPPPPSAFMSNVVQNENGQFGSFEMTPGLPVPVDPEYGGGLAAWAQSTDGLYTFLSNTTSTPPAGSSTPTTDPAGTYSGAGASAPTIDPAGSYSSAGASAPTLAQPGYYVPTAGASSETPDDPDYYTPYAGATAELLAQAPVISGTVAGQSTPSGQSDTPFASVTITDPNIDTLDSPSIQLTGAGGTLADGAGFTGLTTSAPGVYLLSGTAAAITSELDALIFTPSAGSGTTTFTLTDTTSVGTSASDSNTTVTVSSGGKPVVSVATFLDDQSTLDTIVGGFDISDIAANITANLDQLNDPNISTITISDNGQVGSSVLQLTSDATAISKLENAGPGPVLLAINDTAADVQAGLSTLVADAGEIASIAASNGPVVVSTATFLADQSTLDKIVGGFAISDTAADVVQNLGALSADPNITSITASNGPVVVSAATFVTYQSTLNEIVGGFEVSDRAANVVAKLSTLNADSHVASITATSGSATLTGGVSVNAPSLSETGSGTSLTVAEALGYAGAFSQGAGSTLSISSADTLSLTGTASLSGTTSGLGALALAGGSDSINSGAKLSVSDWSISGAGTSVTLDENLSYGGSFSEGAGDTFVLSGGHLLLSGAATFAGGTVDGSKLLETEGTTTVSGLTIGGTVEWENTKALTQSGGTVTIGDSSGDKAILDNTATGTYDIADNSGITRGSSTASDIKNAGLFEKTGGTVTSTIAPAVTNTGTIEVTAGTLDLTGAVTGKGKDTISGASTLEFGAGVSTAATLGDQDIGFTGGGTLHLLKPTSFYGEISDFAAGDTVELLGSWAFSGISEAGDVTTLTLASGSTTHGFEFVGDSSQSDFSITSGKTTTIGYA